MGLGSTLQDGVTAKMNKQTNKQTKSIFHSPQQKVCLLCLFLGESIVVARCTTDCTRAKSRLCSESHISWKLLDRQVSVFSKVSSFTCKEGEVASEEVDIFIRCHAGELKLHGCTKALESWPVIY